MTASPPLDRNAEDFFGAMAKQYDSLIRRCVPRYDEMIERLLDYLPARAESVLELGCGTGNLSIRLADRYPPARLTLVDAAPEMIALTRARTRDRASMVTARFEELDFEPASFDVITSSISLHHVRDMRALYARLRSFLRPGGTFRFSDQLAGATDANHTLNWERWLEFCRAKGNCTETEVRQLLDHAAAHDHYTPLPEHFRLLTESGFASPDCVWRNWIWGIVTADVS